jgi:hypothetical protein
MKFRCIRCDRIYATRTRAIECCSRVEPVLDRDVTLCPIDGDACRSPGCAHCRGTGYMLKERSTSDANEAAAGA